MSDSPGLLPIVIRGLRMKSDDAEHAVGGRTERILLPEDAPLLSVLWGLRKNSVDAEYAVGGRTERILLPEDAQLSVLWAKLTGKALAFSESYID